MFVNKTFNVITTLTILISLLMFIAIFDDGLKIFRNKDKLNKMYLYITLGLFLIIMIVSFVIDMTKKEFVFNVFLNDIITLIGSTILINYYIIYYLNKTEFGELELFKQ